MAVAPLPLCGPRARLASAAIVVLLCARPDVWAQATPDTVTPVVNPPTPTTQVSISVADFMQPGRSVREAFRLAVDACRQQSAARLVIPPGRHVFEDPQVMPQNYHLALTNLSDLTIEGNGAELVFQHLTLGVLVLNSRRVVVRNLSVDYGFSYASPGIVKKEANGSTTIEVSAAFPVTSATPVVAVSRFDAARFAWTKSHIESYYPRAVTLVAPQTFSSPDFGQFRDGDEVLLRHHVYTAHAFYIATGSADITLDRVTIYGAPGMAVTVWGAERGFRFSQVRIVRKLEPGRLISTAADGIHISHTRGHIIVEDCDFSGQGDDSLNIHNLWLTLAAQTSPTSVVLTRGTYGLVEVGSRLRLVRPADLVPYAEATVAQVTYDGNDRYTVTLQQPLPGPAAVGDLVENADRNNPMFIVRRNVFHDHRARGMLIQSPNGIIEDNVVRDVTISGIHLTVDNNFFKEASALDNVTLRRNTFIRCSYGSPEQYAQGRHMACVNLIADVPAGIGAAPIHRNITIEDNVVLDTPGLAFLVGSSDRVLVRNNTTIRSNQMPFADRRTGQDIDAAARGSIMITRASNITVTGNRQIVTPDMFDSGTYVDPRNTSNVVVTPAPDLADADGDGLPDTWEAQFGLSPLSAAGSDGASGDPDGDGISNAAEHAAGTHPRGFFRRYLAEGAINSFFDVRLALLNMGSQTADVLLRFLQPGGATLLQSERLPVGRRRTLTRADLTALSSPDFSIVVESDQPIVLDRTMSWDASGYGSHAETGVPSPATTWYLAEGSTSGDFALFYLLQNPNPTATTATVRYLLPFGQAPIEHSYPLAANSRTTIPVDNQGPALASTDVSAVVTAPLPIIVERAMYLSRPGQVFAAGHGSAGVTAPALGWFLAEGATGPFFDLFILIANPNSQAAQVTVNYLLLNGATHTKGYTIPANGRFTIWVDDEQIPAGSGVKPLDNVAVSTTLTATNGVPVIVERTMWWPSPALTSDFWTEAHNSSGATVTATRWGLAEGELGGPQSAETYILIANASAFAGQARVRLYFEDGTSAVRTVSLLPRSRTNVAVSSDFPQAAGRRFGAVIESLGTTPAQIVVERAMYTSPGGVTWAAGTNALGTPLP